MAKWARFSTIAKAYNFDMKKKSQAYEWAREGKIKSKKDGGKVLFDIATTSALLESKGYVKVSDFLNSKPKKKSSKRAIVSIDIPAPLGESLESHSNKIAMIFIPTSSLKEVLEIVLR